MPACVGRKSTRMTLPVHRVQFRRRNCSRSTFICIANDRPAAEVSCDSRAITGNRHRNDGFDKRQRDAGAMRRAREAFSPFLREALRARAGDRRAFLERGRRGCGRARAWQSRRDELEVELAPAAPRRWRWRSRSATCRASCRSKQVTRLLSDFADRAIDRARRAPRSRSACRTPSRDGFAVIAMGKLGSRELNYSSDVDLLLLFDPETLPQRGARRCRRSGGAHRPAADRAAAEADRGRLCRSASTCGFGPSPEVTPIALPVNAAISHYESSRSAVGARGLHPRARRGRRHRARASASSTRSSRSSGGARSISA